MWVKNVVVGAVVAYEIPCFVAQLNDFYGAHKIYLHIYIYTDRQTYVNNVQPV